MPVITVTLEEIKNPRIGVKHSNFEQSLISFNDSFVLLGDDGNTIIYDVLADTQYKVSESAQRIQELLFEFTADAEKRQQIELRAALSQIIAELHKHNMYLEMILS